MAMSAVRPSVSTFTFDVDTLIVVACHAVYKGGPTNGEDEAEWLIEPFQTGETQTFIEHIRRGVQELAKTDGKGLLVFSGGATKKLKSGGKVQRTEAEGYADIAIKRNLFDLDAETNKTTTSLRHCIFEENYATDSYQNVLLSLIQYPIWLRRVHETLGSDGSTTSSPTAAVELTLPKRLVVISHEFKRARFMQLHLPAIHSIWPSKEAFEQMDVDYLGINPPFDEHKIKEIEEGDRKRGFGVWKDDLFGTGNLLSGKRSERGWDGNLFLQHVSSEFGHNVLTLVEDMTGGRKPNGGTR